jgi:hypothetical protein
LADQLSGWMQSHELTKNKEKKSLPTKKKKRLTTLQKAVRGNLHQQKPNDRRYINPPVIRLPLRGNLHQQKPNDRRYINSPVIKTTS